VVVGVGSAPDGANATSEGQRASVLEWGGAAEVEVWLTTRPKSPVTVSATVADGAEWELDVWPPSVSFMPLGSGPRWRQKVHVGAEADAVDRGSGYSSSISLSATSNDALFAFDEAAVAAGGRSPFAPPAPWLPVDVADDDLAGTSVLLDSSSPSPQWLREGSAGGAEWEVVLEAEPAAAVTVSVALGEETQTQLWTEEALTFSALDWDVPQRVRVTAKVDEVDVGVFSGSTRASMAVTSADALFDEAGSTPSEPAAPLAAAAASRVVELDVLDAQRSGVRVLLPSTGRPVVGERARRDSMGVVLATEPRAEVVLNASVNVWSTGDVAMCEWDVARDAPCNGTSVLLTFAPSNWWVAQQVQVEARYLSSTEAKVEAHSLSVTLLNTTDARYETDARATLFRPSSTVEVAVLDLPVLTFVVPVLGPAAGAEADAGDDAPGVIHVYGRNFGLEDDFPVAYVDDVPCLSTRWVSDTHLVCRTPPGQGAGVLVHVRKGAQRTQERVTFSYEKPIVFAVDPVAASTVGGEVLRVLGINMGTASGWIDSVYVGAKLCRAPQLINDNEVRCITPEGVGKGHVVRVTVRGQTNENVECPEFRYLAPTVSKVSGCAGDVEPKALDCPTLGEGTVVRVEGADFGAAEETLNVTVGALPCPVVEHGHTWATCVLPAGMGFDQPVVVSSEGQLSAEPGRLSYAAPSLDAGQHFNVSASGKMSINITGRDFGPTAVHAQQLRVDVGGQPCWWQRWLSPGLVECGTPPGSGLENAVRVYLAGQASSDDTAVLSYVPFVENLTPYQVQNGTVVRVRGHGFVDAGAGRLLCCFGFTSDGTCRFPEPATYVNASEVQCRAPASVPERFAELEVAVSVDGGGNYGRDGQNNLVNYAPPPHLTALDPPSAPVAGHAVVRVTGQFLRDSRLLKCRVGAATLDTLRHEDPDVFWLSDTEVLCRVPPAAEAGVDSLAGGTVTLTLTNNDQQYHVGLPFTYEPAPVVTGVTQFPWGLEFGGNPVNVSVENLTVTYPARLRCRYGFTSVHARQVGEGVVQCAPPPLDQEHDWLPVDLANPTVVTSVSSDGERFGGSEFNYTYAMPCRFGYYCPQNVSAGSEGPTRGGPAFVRCPPGHYCPGESMYQPLPCPRGTYQPYELSGSCYPCPDGTYCPQEGMTVPWACPEGVVCDVSAALGARQYNAELRDTAAVVMDVGLERPGGVCPEGHYCTGGAREARPARGNAERCPLEYPASPCVLDRVLRSPGSAPEACPNAFWCGNSTVSPTLDTNPVNYTAAVPNPCFAGFDCDEGSARPSGVRSCEPGFYCPGFVRDVAEVVPKVGCERGNYCPSSQMTDPKKCEPGTYNPYVRTRECLQCGAGFICPPVASGEPTGLIAAVLCPEGSVCSQESLVLAFERCPAGSFCGKGVASVQSVPYTADFSAIQNPVRCPEGVYCLSGVVSPEQLRSGTLTETSLTLSCTKSSEGAPCTRPSHWAVTEHVDTTEVNSGRFPQQCLPGTYCQEGTNTPSAQACPLGHFCPSPASLVTLSNADELIQAYWPLMAEFDDSITNTTLVECRQQQTCDLLRGTIQPLQARRGYFAEGTGNALDSACFPGTFQDKRGQGLCEDCLLGHQCPEFSCDGEICPTVCDAGFVCGERGIAKQADQCPAGYYCNAGTVTFDPLYDPAGGESLPLVETPLAGLEPELGNLTDDGFPGIGFAAGLNVSANGLLGPYSFYWRGLDPAGEAGSPWSVVMGFRGPGGNLSTGVLAHLALGHTQRFCDSRPNATYWLHEASAWDGGVFGGPPATNYSVRVWASPGAAWEDPSVDPAAADAVEVATETGMLGTSVDPVWTRMNESRVGLVAHHADPENMVVVWVRWPSLTPAPLPAVRLPTEAEVGGQHACAWAEVREGNVTRTVALNASLGGVIGAREAWHLLDLSVSGTSYALYLNGMLALSFEDSTQPWGMAGVAAYGMVVMDGLEVFEDIPFNRTESSKPIPCPARTFCLGGAASGSFRVATDGTFPDEGDTVYPQPCTEGFYCEEGTDTPQGRGGAGQCPAGSYCPKAVAAPIPARLGRSVELPGRSSDTACPANTYANQTGLVTCLTCPVGFYCFDEVTETGTVDPKPCPQGTYKDARNVESRLCVECPAGTYNDDTGANSLDGCKPTPLAMVCSFTGVDNKPKLDGTGGVVDGVCEICAEGFFCPSGTAKLDDETRCPEGFFCGPATDPFNVFDNKCDPGFVCEKGTLESNKQFQKCKVNHFCRPQQSWHTPCPPGTASSIESTDITDCEISDSWLAEHGRRVVSINPGLPNSQSIRLDPLAYNFDNTNWDNPPTLSPEQASFELPVMGFERAHLFFNFSRSPTLMRLISTDEIVYDRDWRIAVYVGTGPTRTQLVPSLDLKEEKWDEMKSEQGIIVEGNPDRLFMKSREDCDWCLVGSPVPPVNLTFTPSYAPDDITFNSTTYLYFRKYVSVADDEADAATFVSEFHQTPTFHYDHKQDRSFALRFERDSCLVYCHKVRDALGQQTGGNPDWRTKGVGYGFSDLVEAASTNDVNGLQRQALPKSFRRAVDGALVITDIASQQLRAGHVHFTVFSRRNTTVFVEIEVLSGQFYDLAFELFGDTLSWTVEAPNRTGSAIENPGLRRGNWYSFIAIATQTINVAQTRLPLNLHNTYDHVDRYVTSGSTLFLKDNTEVPIGRGEQVGLLGFLNADSYSERLTLRSPDEAEDGLSPAEYPSNYAPDLATTGKFETTKPDPVGSPPEVEDSIKWESTDFWGDKTIFASAYMPYFSNCAGYDSYVPIFKLTENENCTLPDPTLTTATSVASFTDANNTDTCDLYITCRFEEDFEAGKVNWFQTIAPQNRQWYLTRKPIALNKFDPKATVRASSWAVADERTAAARSVDDYFDLLGHDRVPVLPLNKAVPSSNTYPATVTLELGFYQKSRTYKEVATAKLSFSDYRSIPAGAEKPEYTFNFGWFALSIIDLIDNFALPMFVFVMITIVLGMFLVMMLSALWAVGRKNAKVLPMPPIDVRRYWQNLARPALQGFGFAMGPNMTAIMLFFFLLYQHELGTLDFLGPFSGSRKVFFELSVTEKEEFRIQRWGLILTVLGLFNLSQTTRALVPVPKAELRGVSSPRLWFRTHLRLCLFVYLLVQAGVLVFTRTPVFKENVLMWTVVIKAVQQAVSFGLNRMLPDKLLFISFQVSTDTIMKTMSLGVATFINFLIQYIGQLAGAIFNRAMKTLVVRWVLGSGKRGDGKEGNKKPSKLQALKKLAFLFLPPGVVEGIRQREIEARRRKRRKEEQDRVYGDEYKRITVQHREQAMDDLYLSSVIFISQLFGPVFTTFVYMFAPVLGIETAFGQFDLQFYVLFGIIMSIMQFAFDILIQNFVEVFYGWKLNQVLGDARERFERRTHRWVLLDNDGPEDYRLRRDLRSINKMCFSSQFYFVAAYGTMGVIETVYGLMVMIRTGYSPFLDNWSLPLTVFVILFCHALRTLVVLFGDYMGVWLVDLEKQQTKQVTTATTLTDKHELFVELGSDEERLQSFRDQVRAFVELPDSVTTTDVAIQLQRFSMKQLPSLRGSSVEDIENMPGFVSRMRRAAAVSQGAAYAAGASASEQVNAKSEATGGTAPAQGSVTADLVTLPGRAQRVLGQQLARESQAIPAGTDALWPDELNSNIVWKQGAAWRRKKFLAM